MVRDRRHILRNLDKQREQVVDVRDAARFAGEAAEPRSGLRSGHIPNSLNLPFTDLVDPESQTLRPPEQLQTRMQQAGIDPKKPVVTSCGSGVTAAVLSLALYVTGHRDVALYDGSWADWGREDADTPVETGRT
jgi:thiosulfate/3-mercaptopyruvate sulfurtransferase